MLNKPRYRVIPIDIMKYLGPLEVYEKYITRCKMVAAENGVYFYEQNKCELIPSENQMNFIVQIN